jgi:hypothetical protein
MHYAYDMILYSNHNSNGKFHIEYVKKNIEIIKNYQNS